MKINMTINTLPRVGIMLFLVPFLLMGCTVEKSDNEEPEQPTQMMVNGKPYKDPSVYVDKFNSHYEVYLAKSSFNIVSFKTKTVETRNHF